MYALLLGVRQGTDHAGYRQSGPASIWGWERPRRACYTARERFCARCMPDFAAPTIETTDGCDDGAAALTCPVCGEEARQEKCKVVCRSERCTWRIIYNCSEF